MTAQNIGANAVVSWAFATPVATMHVRSEANGAVRVRGRVIGDYTNIRGLINQGQDSTAVCETDPDYAPPE